MIIKRLELTEVQKGIYFDCQVDAPISYNISAAIYMEDLNETYFENAVSLVIHEQEALRSCLEISGDMPVIVIQDQINFYIEKEDLSGNPEVTREEQNQIVEKTIEKPFDLHKAPLFRIKLVKIEEKKHLCIICIHHIICDGLSLEIFKNRLLDYYNTCISGDIIELKQNANFASFIEKENKKLATGKYEKQKQFWLEKMKGAEALSLTADFVSAQSGSILGKEKRFEIPKDLMKNITDVSMEQEVTVFMFFLGAFQILMNRYTRQEDIIISSPFTYRPGFDLEDTIGCFIYTLPIRLHIDENTGFSTILEKVSKEFIEAYKHIGYPNNLIMRDSSLVPVPGTPSVFDYSFVYDVYENSSEYQLKTTVAEQDCVTFPGNMMVILNKTPEKDYIKIQYKPDVFSEDTIDYMGKRFLKLLNCFVEDVNVKISDINLLTENEETLILENFNQSSFIPYQPQSIVEIFHQKVAEHPERTALIYKEQTETYASVNAKANQLAQQIIKRRKTPNEAVGIQLERSPYLVISLLAVLKAGCAYVPIDPGYPAGRKEFIFEDAFISIFITTKDLPYDENWKLEFLFADEPETYNGNNENPEEKLDPYSLAYIEYTSGSTGTPKGVMIENHSVVNTLMDLERRFPLMEQDVYLLKTAYTFDVSVTELFGWFMGEGALFILEQGGEKNPELIIDEIERNQVTHINFVPSMFRLFLDSLDNQERINKLNSLKWIFIGGEAVTPDIVHKFYALHTNIKLENVYGPTECTIWASHYSIKSENSKNNIPIGKPLNEIRWYVVGEQNQLQPIGIPGELCLSGAGLARGYLNREELTKEKFIQNPFYREGKDPKHFKWMYRTGDLARWLPDGTIDFLGRIDFQVKIRGVRLELGEIENALTEYEGILQSVVVVKEAVDNAAVLCAYYMADKEISPSLLREHLRKELPSYMIPSFFVYRKELPCITSGKVDRKALMADKEYRNQETSEKGVEPVTELEIKIAAVWKEVLSVQEVGIDDNFFDIGGHSLALIQLHNKLKKAINKDFSITILFQMPTVRLLAKYFTSDNDEQKEKQIKKVKEKKSIGRQDIAIIGMSVKVPGAQNIQEFWEVLRQEKECIHFYKDEELEKLGVSEELLNSSNYVKAKGRVDEIEYFDPGFFEYTPGEVRMMSPQLRLLYKGAWEALEDAGYYPGSTDDKIGIFIGGSDDFEWYRKVLFGNSGYSDKYQAFTFSTNHFLASRLAYKLNIKGPVFSALTGCSTTLVTPHLSCQSLMLGECDLAIAGGVTVELPNEGGYFYEEGMMFSPDGHCRPFDADAKGTVFSNGMGLVVMKRYEDALRDGDHIYAVIKGSAINNDGNQKIGFAAPSVNGQAEAIKEAYRVADVDPETVSYIEAHGTGTLLGDPIEVESLTTAFSTDKTQYCVLGSVKGNIGHTDTAAGVVGLAKVALSLHHKFLPGTVNYNNPNPKVDFLKTPFLVKAHGEEWKESVTKSGVLRAGINSFGVGGTNAHMILEAPSQIRESSPCDDINLLTFSAKSPAALLETSRNIMHYIINHPEINVSDAAWTLEAGRKDFPFRKVFVLCKEEISDIETVLSRFEDASYYEVKKTPEKVYFMFPGQGSQYQGMGKDLLRQAEKRGISKIFAKYIEQVFAALGEEREEFEEVIYGETEPLKINQTKYSQMALFATEYALAKSLMDIGIQPDGFIGHSIGEVTAAAAAGVWKLEDAVKIVKARGDFMQMQKPGVMLAVMANAEEIKKELGEEVWLSLRNTTNNCVVGGSEWGIEKFQKRAEQHGWKTIRVKTSHAFHTPMMEEAAEAFEKYLEQFEMQEPFIPIVSNASGTWVSKGEMTVPQYWANHIMKTVNFEKNLEEMLHLQNAVFIETGAGRTLSSFAMQHSSRKQEQHFINLLRHPRETEQDISYINNKLGQLWCRGVDIDWTALQAGAVRNRISLPAYVFEKEYFPVDIRPESKLKSSTETCKAMSDENTENVLKPEVVFNREEMDKLVLDAYQTVFGFDTIQVDQDFFELGGDSLKAVSLSNAVKNVAGIKVDISQLFQYATPKKLAAYLKQTVTELKKDIGIQPVQKQEYYPLSSAQSRMFALYLLDKKTVSYNLPSATRIQGQLDLKRMEKAVEKLILRHESLRTSFVLRENQPVQVVHETVPLPVEYCEAKGAEKEEIDQLIHKFVKPFELDKAPLFRVSVVKIKENESMLLFDLHHIIADGTSVEIITKDFNQLYFGEIEKSGIQYKDFAVWQNKVLKSEEMKKEKDFWLEYLGDDLPVLQLPTDFPRPHVKSFEGNRIHFSLDKKLTSRLFTLSHEAGVTMFMTMLSCWNILLARYAGQEDIIVGTSVAGRTQEEIKETVGMFVNMLAMRNKPQNTITFKDFLQSVKQNALQAFEHQNYQFDELVEQLNLKRELNRNPLFDVCFDYQNMQFYDLEVEGIRFIPYELETHTATYDLLLTCQENKEEEKIEGFLEYSTMLYKQETIERMLEHFLAVLESITSNQDIMLQDIHMVSQKEAQRLINDFNQTKLDLKENYLIQELLEQNAENIPHKIALITANGKKFTYADINQRANVLAWKLIELGVKKDVPVGIIPCRNENLIISLFGVLKAGGAYVPIDPGFPEERISYMLEESGAQIVVCPKEYESKIKSNYTLLDISDLQESSNSNKNPVNSTTKDGLANIIFTSGSTGKPKGVMLQQNSILNFIADIKNRKLFETEHDRIISVTTLSFDIFGFESLVPLCTGNSIYLANEKEQLDPALAAQKILEHKATHILSTVSRIKAFVENPDFEQALKQLTCILSGGENFSLALLKDLQKRSNAKIFNMYGPTETTIWSTTKELTNENKVNIGTPIANTQVFVLNSGGKLQPTGVFGELCIGGQGLARGYLNNEEETKKKFVFSEVTNTVIYKTGDRARILASGEIELLGRLDSQIKIRGYRIELSEIEKTVLLHEKIKEAVVLPFEDKNNNKQLVVYYCVKDLEQQDSSWLKKWLQERLPHYMIPSYFIKLETMPTLLNGKINKRALPIPQAEERTNHIPVLQPANQLEKSLLEIWSDVLGSSQISIRDNFFDIGGNSLGLILVNNRINSLIGQSVPLVQLFENPTIESLVKSLKSQNILLEEQLENVQEHNVEKVKDIAVIGLACHFPGAENVKDFWGNLVSGVESIAEITEEELIQAGVDKKIFSSSNYVRAKGVLENAEYFDSEFFDYPYQESNRMDPQIRILHQCVWKVLEDGGYDSFRYNGKIGLFAGSGSNVSWMVQFIGQQKDILNAFEVMTLNEKDFITTKISYKLNLKGPSMNVQTACSTSLVAVHEAVKSLQDGESDMAVAGGVSISYPRKEGYLWHEGMIFSKDGHCRPFAEDATGTVSGNGCGVVLLKPLEKALQDGDNIYAVIKGSAINNDGIDKIGYTAPSVSGQRKVIEEAMGKAGVQPEEIHYLEAHGTGTKLGDPIEIEALQQAWKTKQKRYCAIGSVKANIGHLDAASGIAGFIKAVLVLHNKKIPPLINYGKANSSINFEHSPFYITTEAKDLIHIKEPLRAGVSSFGIGGTNAHIILEEAPAAKQKSVCEKVNLLLFSGKSKTSVINTSEEVLAYLEQNPDINISDAAWTLQEGRKHFPVRKALLVKETTNIKSAIHQFRLSDCQQVSDMKKPVIYSFAAKNFCQGMGQNLYIKAGESTLANRFKINMDLVCSVMEEAGYPNGVQHLLEKQSQEGNNRIDSQLSVFAVSYSMANVFGEIGICPDGLVGDEIGKITAYVLSGTLTVTDAVDMIMKGNAIEDYPLHQEKIPILSGIYENAIVIEMPCLQADIDDELASLYQITADLWCQGVDIDWKAVKGNGVRKRISLPTYVFDKKYHNSDASLKHFEQQNIEKIQNKKISVKKDKGYVGSRLEIIWKELLGCEEVSIKDDFFNLGGDSLTAIKLASYIQSEFQVEMPIAEIFSCALLGKMTDWIYQHISNEMPQSDAENIINPIEKREYYEVSSSQKRMYAVNKMIGDSIAYNLGSVYMVEGVIDKDKLTNVFDALVQRHESFRTSFHMKEGEVIQIIQEQIPSVVEFGNSSEADLNKEIKEYIRPFDLSKAPLLRVKLISLNEKKHVLIIDMHHIISDQSSIAVLLNEFATLYHNKKLPNLTIHYKDFAYWQNRLYESKDFEKQIAYWENEFHGELPVLDLHTDFKRPQFQSYNGDFIQYEIGEELSKNIVELSRRLGTTPYMIMMAAVKLVLWKSTGQKDLVVGTGIAGRRHADTAPLVGMFVNTLAVRSQVQETLTVSEYIQYIKEKMVQAYENQDCQFEMLIDKLHIQKDLSRNPLFDVMFNYINMGTEELEMEGLSVKPWTARQVECKFDITWTIQEKKGCFYADMEYATSLFRKETIEALGSRLLVVLNFIIENADQKLNEICILTSKERKWLIEELNQTDTNAPLDKTIIEIFEGYVSANGEHTAIVWEDTELSYSQLNQKANQLSQLLFEQGVKHGDRIAILLDRGPLQIISILGILKSGCVYVPIDPDYPDARINFILEDSSSRMILTDELLEKRVEREIPCIFISEELENRNNVEYAVSSPYMPKEVCGEDTLYIMYTSGSTGIPKGTLISHSNVIRVVKNTNYIEIESTDCFLQLSNYAFDGSVFDIFGAILNGASLVLISKETAIEIPQLADFIKEKEITAFFMTAALFNVFVESGLQSLTGVRKLLVGGDAVSVPHARKALEILGPGHLINGYGPTETTVFAVCYPIDHIEEDAESIPIGYAISNTSLYILDEQGQPVPANVPGELYIGGKGVSKGYLNREELTKEKFVTLKFAPYERVYRTGDRVMRRPTGEILFLGRVDFQIKLRGFRVELGEIETHIKELPKIRDAVVTAVKDKQGSLYIAAYYTALDIEGKVEPDDIKKLLSDKLPEYMIPARMKQLETFPLTVNRKVDRKALPYIEEESVAVTGKDAPTNETEKVILEKMQMVLDHSGIGILDAFFDVGGNSIKAIAFVQALSKCGINIKVNDVFRYPTVKELAVLSGAEVFSVKEPKHIEQNKMLLNPKQINAIAEREYMAFSLLSNLIGSADKVLEFPMSPVQKAHAEAGSDKSGCMFVLSGKREEEEVRSLAAVIIKENQMLHCIKEQDKPIWNQYDIMPIFSLVSKNIAYLDIRDYEQKTQEELVKTIYSYLVFSEYKEECLPWRVCCLRTAEASHQIIWGFDHTAFDGMSGEIIKSQMKNPIAVSSKYDEYVSLLAEGPQGISEGALMDLFSLRQWKKENELFMGKLSLFSTSEKNEIQFKLPLPEQEVTDVWGTAFVFVKNLLCQYTERDSFPYALVHYGRNYVNQEFFDCIGEFLDIVPMCAGENTNEVQIEKMLSYCRAYSVNFLSLLYDEELSKEYKQINGLLSDSYITKDKPKNFALFNFQGYVAKEERTLFESQSADSQCKDSDYNNRKDNMLAKLLITVNYDEENIYISMESAEGLQVERIRAMNSSISRYMDIENQG
ncbi:hybrid non-ribosomal peptide synthetase/type I polyketide synthase [Anaeromicropila populeti]|uniref:Amino acid adenylation domain-containing protein n=1 Tax=Anaeromicropila populeti TaxID=37658 RepID=A0A1I6LGF5_9FIRM|nr:hybrid non-ribosomal peptide synthetase/type I polyketide synthase [Anaeromicropila populeti]SFS02400.1 amino acid adenylation domain-containing protein [Anaeromicropila populeti]